MKTLLNSAKLFYVFRGSSMVEQIPVDRQLPGVIQVEERGEFGEAFTGNPEPSRDGNIAEGVETIPQGSSAEV